jgi:hypothetical protein
MQKAATPSIPKAPIAKVPVAVPKEIPIPKEVAVPIYKDRLPEAEEYNERKERILARLRKEYLESKNPAPSRIRGIEVEEL